MTRHAQLSPSASHRWIACPGSVNLEAQFPSTTSPAASQGIMAHALGERILSGRPSETFTYEDHGLQITATPDIEMRTHVRVLTDRVADLKRQHPGCRVYLEQRVSLEHIRKNMFGTADVIIVAPRQKKIIVIDYKHGFTPVHLVKPGAPWPGDPDAENVNSQLLIYGAGALEMFGDEKTRAVQLEVVQPRCPTVDPVQSVELTADGVAYWARNQLWEAACATEMADAPLVAGDHCRFCAAQSACPVLTREVEKLALVDFQTSIEATPIDPPAPETMSPAQIAHVLQWAPIIDSWLRAVEAEAQRLLELGQQVEGFKLVRKRANREWPTEDEGELCQLLLKAGSKKIARADLLERTLMSPARVEKLLGKEVVNKVALKPEAGLTIAATSDKREAVEPVAFTPVDYMDLI